MGGRKPRSDSQLKLLPEKAKRQLWENLNTPGFSLQDAVGWCREELAVGTSVSSLSEFYSWYGVQLSVRGARSVSDQLVGMLEKEGKIDKGALVDAGEALFLANAVEKGDVEVFAQVRRVMISAEKAEQARAALEHQVEKFEFDAARAVLKHLADLKEIGSDRGLNEDGKIEAVRKRLFGVDPGKEDGA